MGRGGRLLLSARISANAGGVQQRRRCWPKAKSLKINKRATPALLGVGSKTGGCRFDSCRACIVGLSKGFPHVTD